MVKKRVDDRVRRLIEHSVQCNTRALLLVVGDSAASQAARVHNMQSQSSTKHAASTHAPSCLWLYSSKLPLSSHRKKRVKQLKAAKRRGTLSSADPTDPSSDPLSVLLSSGSAECVQYRHASERALGRSFSTVVLQDFAGVTPNLLAKASECCEGGGVVMLLVSGLDSLTKLYTLAMDVHSRFRTESHQEVTPRFNERLLLSLSQCESALVVDDELNVLPISSSSSALSDTLTSPFSSSVSSTTATSREEQQPAQPERNDQQQQQFQKLQDAARGVDPDEVLLKACKTGDQARTLVSLLQSVRGRLPSSSAHATDGEAAAHDTTTAALVTAARGRGKSASMGLAAAGAISMGVAQVAVTSPAPENVKALFDFTQHGLIQAGFTKHQHFSTNNDTGSRNKLITHIHVFKDRQQSVTYVEPTALSQSAVTSAEVIIIDEAAAIPLPTVQAIATASCSDRRSNSQPLLLLSSTSSGYEGTGRSLSFKLTNWLRSKQSSRLKELSLREPIRYAINDPLERFINRLLCLDSQERMPRIVRALPQPEQCELYAVSRDTLFSCHPSAERFLQQVMALYASSHYRTSPDDLQLLSDAPAHRLFVLVPPVDESDSRLPEVLAVIQLALEGSISRQSARKALAGGTAPSGDLVPWTVSQQFQDQDFPGLSGARIVRIAVHPEVQRAGYGSRAIKQLHDYFAGVLAPLTEEDPSEAGYQPEPSARTVHSSSDTEELKLSNPEKQSLHNEKPQPRTQLPPLLQPVSERPPERINWIGAAFGLSDELMRFWSRLGYRPLYLRQTHSGATAEHTCLVLREVHQVGGVEHRESTRETQLPDPGWLSKFGHEFRCRLASLLPGPFRDLAPTVALTLLLEKQQLQERQPEARVASGKDGEINESSSKLSSVLKPDGSAMSHTDLDRLSAYARGISDHSTIRDLVQPLAAALFFNRLNVSLSHAQSAVLLVIGLQQRDIKYAADGLGLPQEQALALYGKALRKVHKSLIKGAEEDAERAYEMQKSNTKTGEAIQEGVDEELDQVGEGAHMQAAIQQKQKEELGTPEHLQQFAIDDHSQDWAGALAGGTTASGRISVKSTKKRKRTLDVPSQRAGESADATDSKRNTRPRAKSTKKKPSAKRKNLG